MAFLSDALARIKPSPTVAITAHARAPKDAGADIISLSAGEPDFDTPPNVRVTAKAAIDRGDIRYTASGWRRLQGHPRRARRGDHSQDKWLIFNSPFNPTGAGYSADELRALTDVLFARPQVWVMSDDIYERIAFVASLA